METERRQYRITFTEPILGTSPRNTEIYSDYIGSKAPDAATLEQEIEALGADTVEERGMTVFPRDPAGNPILWDYQVKGFFKDSCGMLARLKGKTESAKLKAFRKIIDGLIFVYPRQIALTCGDLRVCQRPLRAQTAQGERVALSSSEELTAGTQAVIEIECYDPALWPAVEEWLDYGAARGIGQWRNSGKGRFTWEELK